MSPPIPFILGLLVLLLHELLVDALPGNASTGQLLPYLILVVVPGAVAVWNGYRVSRVILAGGVPRILLRLQLSLQGLSVPIVFATWVFLGGLPNLVTQSFPNSHLFQTVGLIAPLLLLEITLRYSERSIERWLDMGNLSGLGRLGPQRLPMVYFLSALFFLFSLATDFAFESRSLQVFVTGTAAGSTLGLLSMVLGLCIALPILFRFFMPTTQRLPSQVADSVRATASALGFSPTAVLGLHTNHRMINAMLIGPLPWPRYLLLSDGLMSLLDPASLRGVVAHEVGHARAGHPGLLVLVYAAIPIFLIYPFMTLGLEDMDPTSLSAAGAVLAVFVMLGLRKMAHQFEYEADIMSADALGGAEPCISALRRVRSVFPQNPNKSSLRHPSEEQRIQNLLAWERDEDYRTAFYRRCKRLRWGIAVALVLAVGASSWVHASLLPLDQVVYELYTGDFRAAEEQLSLIDAKSIPSFKAKDYKTLSAEVSAAIEIDGDGGKWQDIRDHLADSAWSKGLKTLERAGPDAALPWLGLALSREVDDPVRVTLYLYCVAVIGEEVEKALQLEQHLFDLKTPAEVINALPGH